MRHFDLNSEWFASVPLPGCRPAERNSFKERRRESSFQNDEGGLDELGGETGKNGANGDYLGHDRVERDLL
jgi:hypothetical protein